MDIVDRQTMEQGEDMTIEDLLEMDSIDLNVIAGKLSVDPRFPKSAEAETNSTPPSPVS